MPTDPPASALASGDFAHSALLSARAALDAFLADPGNPQRIHTVAKLLARAFASGNKALIVGNGGSLCDAMHFAEELTGRFRSERPPLPALACTDPGHLSCVANDYGYAQVFARFVQAHGKPGDVLIVLSTSGNSENVILALEAARTLGLATVALLGKDGGRLKGRADHEWIAPGQFADRIQEIHMLVLHTLIEGVERELYPALYAAR